MKTLADNSVDAVVTDPPYGLAFMGKKWDYSVPSIEIWREVLRVLKPGGHVLSFGGTRTYHRMVVNIEDAGFEIRDQVCWLYGSGFPKSHNIGKAIDKISGAEPIKIADGRSGSSSRAYQSEEKTTAGYYEITKSNSEWDGWGSALKPANEPIVLARKPLEKNLTLAQNVLKWGTGGLNIDASRIGYAASENVDFSKVQDGNIYGGNGIYGEAEQKQTTPLFKSNGRWPANLILDETAAEMLPVENKQSVSRFFYVAKASKSERNAGLEGMPEKDLSFMITGSGKPSSKIDTDGKERDRFTASHQNTHPTVKPIKLMEYLCKLITPPNGTILDPFTGSGSTGVAATKLGFKFIGCEMNLDYVQIAQRRIANVET